MYEINNKLKICNIPLAQESIDSCEDVSIGDAFLRFIDARCIGNEYVTTGFGIEKANGLEAVFSRVENDVLVILFCEERAELPKKVQIILK